MPTHTQDFLRPRAIEKIFGRILTSLVWIGLIRGHFYVLEVRGRNTGKVVSVPVDPIEFEAHRYLVCARGNSQWVRNARAAGEVMLARAFHRDCYAAHELPAAMRPPVLKAYLDRFASEVQRFFPVPKGSPVTAFNDLATRYPVFELTRRDPIAR